VPEMAGDRARRQARTRRAEHEAEVRFWRNLAALSRYARPQDLPRLRNLERRGLVLPVFIPAQRTAPPGVPAKPRTQWGSR
jgi:hypothetical protein